MLSGRSATQIAGELGLNVLNMHEWKQKFKELPSGPVAGTQGALHAGERRLQEELPGVVQQRDILKKPWA